MSNPYRYGMPVMPGRVENPRIAYESWLAINFVPVAYHEELGERLDAMQEQAVHMAARKLRESGHTEAADLIDPVPAEERR